MRALALLLALPFVLAGCLGSAGTDDIDVEHVAPEVPDVDAAALLADLRSFAATYSERAGNTEDHLGARDHLATAFEEAGLEVWRQEFETGLAQENIVGIHWGEVRDQWVVVGAHYDMVTKDCAVQCVTRPYSEGAYDDGSGTMMTVHLAERFAAIDPYYTIAFVGFDGEERGLEGSAAFVDGVLHEQAHPFTDEDGRPLHIGFRGMLNLDMIGLNWPGVEAPIYFDDNSPELQEYVRGKAAEIGFPEDMVQFKGISLGRSDYAHFFREGVPTGFMISDFEEWQLPADIPVTVPPTGLPVGSAYPFWHVEDTYETMELMAGSAEDLEAGFQTATELAAGVVHFFAMHDGELTAEVVE